MNGNLTLVLACVLTGFTSVGVAANSSEPPAVKHLVGAGYVFPSSANVQGAFGAYFRTRMVLTNSTGLPITIIAALSTPSGFSAGRQIPLAAAQTRIQESFLADVFGFTGGGGINLIEAGVFSGAPKPFVAVAEVYVDGVNGRCSTPITGLFTDDQVVTPSSRSRSRMSTFEPCTG